MEVARLCVERQRSASYVAVVDSYGVTGLGVPRAEWWPEKGHETDGHEGQAGHQQRDRHKEH